MSTKKKASSVPSMDGAKDVTKATGSSKSNGSPSQKTSSSSTGINSKSSSGGSTLTAKSSSTLSVSPMLRVRGHSGSSQRSNDSNSSQKRSTPTGGKMATPAGQKGSPGGDTALKTTITRKNSTTPKIQKKTLDVPTSVGDKSRSPVLSRSKMKPVKKARDGYLTISLCLTSLELVQQNTDIDDVMAVSGCISSDKCKALYDWVSKHKVKILKDLNDASSYAQNKGVTFTKLEKSKSQCHIEVCCQSLEALVRLENQFASGELQGMINDVICCKQALTGLAWSRGFITVTVTGRQTDQCRDALVTSDATEECFLSHSRLASTLNIVRVELRRQLKDLRMRYSDIEAKSSDLSTALRLGKPADKTSFDSVQDVADCYKFLCMSNSMGEMLNTAIVRDFLLLVKDIRACVTDIYGRLEVMEPHIRAQDLTPDLGLSHAEELVTYLRPGYSYVDVKPCANGNNKIPQLNILERSLFSGLFYFVPDVLNKMSVLVEDLSGIIPEK